MIKLQFRLSIICLFLPTLFAGTGYSELSDSASRHGVRQIQTAKAIFKFSEVNGDLISVHPCYPSLDNPRVCAEAPQTALPLIHIVPDSSDSSRIKIQISTDEEDSLIRAVFLLTAGDTVIREIIYTMYLSRYRFDITIRTNRDTPPTVQLSKPDRNDWVCIGDKAHKVRPGDVKIKRTRWAGYRGRFWTSLISVENRGINFSASTVDVAVSDATDTLHGYCGPVEFRSLGATDRNLTKLLFPLWFWVRWISIGLLALLNLLMKLPVNAVVSLVLLSVAVKLLMSPLYLLAEKWQRKVNEQKSLLAPHLETIGRKYKGEEKNRETLKLYKEHHVSPFYEMKSLFGAAIQIPIFFAAYHMLSENIALCGKHVWWIIDFTRPDNFAKFPVALPFIGQYFNLLPLLMTAITVITARIYSDQSLSLPLQKKQRKNLYIMAVFFLVLLYTSPAGMVLYWTTNNLLSLISTIGKKFYPEKQEVPA